MASVWLRDAAVGVEFRVGVGISIDAASIGSSCVGARRDVLDAGLSASWRSVGDAFAGAVVSFCGVGTSTGLVDGLGSMF